MRHVRWFRAVVTIPLLTIAAACGGGSGDSKPQPPSADWYVNASLGSDAAPGTVLLPFRTLTHALSVAAMSEVVYAFPGTYDAALGETFPLLVPAGVTLLGSESDQGGGSVATEIVGGGVAPAPNPGGMLGATIVPGAGSTVAGFRIANDQPPSAVAAEAVVLPEGAVTLRNNRIVDSEDGVYCYNAVGDHVIRGNVIQGHATSGIVFDGGGEGSVVESNRITGNLNGAEFHSTGGDMGGGSPGSLGLNVLSCNTGADLLTDASALTTIAACFNAWDHVAPTVAAGPGVDISNANGAAVVIVGATVQAGGCP